MCPPQCGFPGGRKAIYAILLAAPLQSPGVELLGIVEMEILWNTVTGHSVSRPRSLSHWSFGSAGRIPPWAKIRPIREVDVWANVAANLNRTPEKATALSLLSHATEIRRGTLRDFQAGAEPAERKTAEGLTPEMVHRAHERRRVDLSRRG